MIIDNRIMDRFDVSNFVSQIDEGMRTTSVLTISNVTGLDSNIVECFSQYQIDAATVDSMVTSTTELNVLGESVSECYS